MSHRLVTSPSPLGVYARCSCGSWALPYYVATHTAAWCLWTAHTGAVSA